MNNPSSAEAGTIPPPDVSFKPSLPPPNFTRWQRFWAFMKTPEGGLLPMSLMVAGAHIFAFHYVFFSEDFVDDFEDDDETPYLVQKLLSVNKSVRHNFDKVREAFSFKK